MTRRKWGATDRALVVIGVWVFLLATGVGVTRAILASALTW